MPLREYQLECELLLPGTPAQVFPFFADAFNLQQITPPWLHFQVLTPAPIAMAPGTLIDYRLKLHGLPLRWRTRISVWEPPFRFIDEQIRGPYRRWIHEHTFEPVGTQTRCRDRVSYAVPGGALVHRLFVQRDVQRIFDYRQQRLRELFAASAPASQTS